MDDRAKMASKEFGVKLKVNNDMSVSGQNWWEGGYDDEVGICHYCNNTATHHDNNLVIDLCDDAQCVSEAYAASDSDTEDLFERFTNKRERS